MNCIYKYTVSSAVTYKLDNIATLMQTKETHFCKINFKSVIIELDVMGITIQLISTENTNKQKYNVIWWFVHKQRQAIAYIITLINFGWLRIFKDY